MERITLQKHDEIVKLVFPKLFLEAENPILLWYAEIYVLLACICQANDLNDMKYISIEI